MRTRGDPQGSAGVRRPDHLPALLDDDDLVVPERPRDLTRESHEVPPRLAADDPRRGCADRPLTGADVSAAPCTLGMLGATTCADDLGDPTAVREIP